MTDKKKIRNIIELFIAWNGETEVIDIANLDSAVDFIIGSMQEEPVAPKVLEDMLNAKTAAESLGISQEEHDRIVDELIYGKEPELVDVDDLPNKEEEPVSEDLESFIYKRLWRGQMGKEITKPIYFGYDELLAVAHSIADWQREQMMQSAICTEVIELCGFMRNGDEKRAIENYVPAIVIMDAKHVNYPGEKVKLTFIKED